jgi:hypothetical protein
VDNRTVEIVFVVDYTIWQTGKLQREDFVMTKPADKLATYALLGQLAEEIQKDQISEAATLDAYSKELTNAAIQVEAASMCLSEAVKELEKIPGSQEWLISLMIRMDIVKYIEYTRQLERTRG